MKENFDFNKTISSNSKFKKTFSGYNTIYNNNNSTNYKTKINLVKLDPINHFKKIDNSRQPITPTRLGSMINFKTLKEKKEFRKNIPKSLLKNLEVGQEIKNQKLNKTVNQVFSKSIKHRTNYNFVTSKLYETNILKKIKKNFEVLPEKGSLYINMNIDNYIPVILNNNNKKIPKSPNKYSLIPKSKVSQFIHASKNSISSPRNTSILNFSLDDESIKKKKSNSLIFNNINYDISSFQNASSPKKYLRKRKRLSTIDASKKIGIPTTFSIINNDILHLNNKKEIINKVKLANYSANDIQKYNCVKENSLKKHYSKQKIEEEILPDEDNGFGVKYNIIKQHRNFEKNKNRIASFNEYLIRNFVFSGLNNPLQESKRKYAKADDFFKTLYKEKIMKSKEKDSNNNSEIVNNFPSEESISLNEIALKNTIDNKLRHNVNDGKNHNFIYKNKYDSNKSKEDLSYKIYNSETTISDINTLNVIKKQNKIIKAQNNKKNKLKRIEDVKLIDKLADQSFEYEELQEPIADDRLINKNNLSKVIKRRQVEKELVNPLRKYISNPQNVNMLRVQMEANLDFQATSTVRKGNNIPHFLESKTTGKTNKKFNNVNGFSFGGQSKRIIQFEI